jgi:pyruvate/2-oxoglutarate dehydrogenase complex dihydrolipoamide acyltransferase (E2) component
MPESTKIDVNSWLEEELFQQYKNNHTFVDESWQSQFAAGKGNGTAAAPPPASSPVPAPLKDQVAALTTQTKAVEAKPAPSPALSKELDSSEQLVPLRGAPARLAENMTLSLAVPTATSQRSIPVKVIDENRRIINQHRSLLGHSKISYTHIIGWAIVKAAQANPALNCAYAEQGKDQFKLVRNSINLGLAIDLASRRYLTGMESLFQFPWIFRTIVSAPAWAMALTIVTRAE